MSGDSDQTEPEPELLDTSSSEEAALPDEVEAPLPTFDFSMLVEDRGIRCHFECSGRTVEWTLPKTLVRRAHKAVTVSHLFDLLFAGPILGCVLRDGATNEPDFLMVPRAVNAVVEQVTKEIRFTRKALGLS